ncbi:MAG: hypothetical protein U0Y68_06230 [Blastocatellia bacterium]
MAASTDPGQANTRQISTPARAQAAAPFLAAEKKGVFARSSTNSEDLPNFSSAGLYTSYY